MTKNTNQLGYVTPIKRGALGRGTDENLIQGIVKARASGMTYIQICRHLHVSKSFVSHILNRSF